jgi:hypothetical protein
LKKIKNFQVFFEKKRNLKFCVELFKGVDIALGPEEWCARATTRIEKMQKKIEAVQKEAQKALRKPRAKKTVDPQGVSE